MIKNCPVCQSKRKLCFQGTILGKYKVNYFFCSACGLLQTETPYWLDDAYNSVIADADTGLVARNIALSKKLAALLFFLFDKNGKYIDIAGGYGMLTRLMRDVGFDFYWSDLYCENILAKEFEASTTAPPFAAVTAFEVLEHIEDPLSFIDDCLKKSDTSTIIFSTELFEGEPLKPMEWWYYALNTGQHISFYQHRTLVAMADKLSLRLYSNNNFHILTDKRLKNEVFRVTSSRLSNFVIYFVKKKMTSKTFTDHEYLINGLRQ